MRDRAATDHTFRHVVRAAVGTAFLAVLLLAWPASASAQIQCEGPGCRPLCEAGPDVHSGQTVPLYTLQTLREGDGAGTFLVSALNPYAGASYNPNKGDRQCATQDTEDPDLWRVKHFCTFHCEHRHYFVNPGGLPQPATTRITPVPDEATSSVFRGWTPESECVPAVNAGEAARRICVVTMNKHREVTAKFGLLEDTEPPAPPTNLRVTRTARYELDLAFDPGSDDEWLGGYEAYGNGQYVTRLPALNPDGTERTVLKVTGLLCGTTYTMRLDAFDSSTSTPSDPVQARTGQCVKIPPNTVFHVKPPKRTKSRTAFFHWGARRNGVELAPSKFKSKCKLNKQVWRNCSSKNGITLRNLKRGKWHTFRVKAGDAQGFDKTPAVYTWLVRR